MKRIFIPFIAGLLAVVSCEDSFDTPNTGYLTGSNASEMVQNDPAFIQTYVQGLYTWMVTFNSGETGGDHDDFGYLSCLLNMDYMCGDIALHGTQNWGAFDYNFDYRQYDYKRPIQIWKFFYTLINNSNTIIDFFSAGSDPEDVTLRGYLGQAYATRALAYMYLSLYYQDLFAQDGSLRMDAPTVPVIYATRDQKTADDITAAMGRTRLSILIDHVNQGLENAVRLLDGYNRPSKNMIDLSVANGIAARWYLLTGQWEKAASAANAARQGYTLMDETRLMSGFMDITDQEVMWGFDHTTETQTAYASFFSQMSSDCPGYAGLDQMAKLIDRSLYDAIPNSDSRKKLFNGADGGTVDNPELVGGTLPYANRKFGYDQQWLQDYIYMRAAEMYLIEAEAAFRMGDTGTASNVLKSLVVTREPSYSKAVDLDEIFLQRRIELWGEGFNYYDWRRLCKDAVRNYEGTNHKLDILTNVNVKAHDKLWWLQIPRGEMQDNPYITEEDQNEL